MVKLIDYLPDVIKDYAIFQTISDSVSPFINVCTVNIDNLGLNQYIMTANEDGIARYEQLLGITPKLTNTLDDRRFRVLAAFSSKLPYTYESLNSELNHLCGEGGYELELLSDLYKLFVRVGLDKKEQYDEVEKLVNKRTPANMIIDLSLLYNDHALLGGFTHSSLAAYSHIELREEAI